jgi:hypothetical protein
VRRAGDRAAELGGRVDFYGHRVPAHPVSGTGAGDESWPAARRALELRGRRHCHVHVRPGAARDRRRRERDGDGSLTARWNTQRRLAQATLDGRLGGRELHAAMLAP